MNIIIDTNIYLNFFRRRGDQSLVLLNSLISFVEKGKFKILLPRQIEDEYWRRKQEVVDEHILELEKGLEAKIPLPLFLESFKKSKDLKATAKKFNSLKREVIAEYKKRATNPNSEINKKINKLFSLSIKIEDNKDILEKSYFRTLKGNPPRKGDKSFGDAIIWEMILKDYKDDNLVIISGDGDYSEKYNSNELHGYLKREWTSKSKKVIKFYTNLIIFINEQSGTRKPFKKEAVKEESYLNAITTSMSPSACITLESLSPSVSPSASISPSAGVLLSSQNNYMERLMNPDKSRCVCCGEEYDNMLGATYSSFGKCPECSKFSYTSIDSIGTKCRRCGKHYHRSFSPITSVSPLGFNEDICEDCRNK